MDKFDKTLLFIIFGIIVVFLFVDTCICFSYDTRLKHAEKQITHLTNEIEKLEYFIENQPDTVVINISNQITLKQ